MAFYRLVRPVDRASGIVAVDFRRDDTSVVRLAIGSSYDLTTTERDRLSAIVELTPDSGGSTPSRVPGSSLRLGDLYDVDTTGAASTNALARDTDGLWKPTPQTAGSSVPAVLAWAAATVYAAGSLMTQNGQTYTRVTAGTSRASFDSTEAALWTPLPTAVVVKPTVGRGGRAIVLGDSTSIVPGTWDTGATTGLKVGENWFNSFCVQSLGKVRPIWNAGVSGENTSSMLARLQADVIDRLPDRLFFLGGTNDGPTGLAEATSFANVDSIVQRCLNAGIDVVMCTITPRQNSTYRLQQSRYNQFVINYAERHGLACIDFFGGLIDAATSSWLSGLSDDQIHPNAAGIQKMVDIALARCADLEWWTNATPFIKHLNDPSNIVPNPLLLTDTNADGLADGWALAGAGSGSAVTTLPAAASPAIGKLQKVVLASAAGLVQLKLTGTSSTLTPGHKYAISGRVQAVPGGSGMTYTVGVIFAGSTGYPQDYPISLWANTMADGYFYDEIVCPAGASRPDIVMRMESGFGSLAVGQLGIVDMTSIGLT